MCDREELYFELFEWLEVSLSGLKQAETSRRADQQPDPRFLFSFYLAQTISNHEALCSAMAMPTMVRTSSSPRPSTSTSSSKSLERTVTYEGSAGPRELMENLVIQASAAKKGFDSTSARKKLGKQEAMTEEMKRMSEEEREEFLKKMYGGNGKERAMPEDLLVAGEEEDVVGARARAVENGKLIDFW